MTARNSAAGAGRASLPHSVVVSLAGVEVRVESNSAAVTTSYAVRYGAAVGAEAPGCDVAVHVTRGEAPVAQDAEVRWQFPDADHATASAPGFSATLDLAAGSAVVHVDEAVAQRSPLFRRAVLEGIPLSLINRRDRHPVHAASVRNGRSALLLHGASGVGKSTLAYVAHRAGLEVLADDATRIQLTPELRVWGEGDKRFLHLLASARDEFEELRNLEPDWLSAGGAEKLSVRVAAKGTQLPYATVACVCLLSRDGGRVARRAATAAEIRDALVNAPEAVADRAPAQRERVAAALAERGGWHLNLSSRPDDAVPHLREMLRLTGEPR